MSSDVPPIEDPRPDDLTSASSLVLVNTGDGKGKSTAAFGTLLRAVAMGWKVCVVQFIKSGDWQVGEQKVAEELGVEWISAGEGFTWDSDDLDHDRSIAQRGWDEAASRIASGEYRLVVLDEVTYPVNWGWIELDQVLGAIRDRPEKVNIILTGRDAPAALIDLADTATEMRSVKHAYESGIRAKKGIDY
ncbi:MAG: cob(I)yrinic acid a,c-diamide adenosyltransferase [Acidimicrobiia bacterium]|nr:cob(I)yrinic acid a,c-diamide adenosyltransferase [Acidimicrobiia bacterium]